MKTAAFFLSFTLSSSAFALDNAVENIQALCGLAKQGKYSQIQSKAQIQADGSVKLASVSGKGEISFSKGDWDGVNQVLQAHQAGDNENYRACVANALPYFKSKVVTTKPTASPSKKAVAKPAAVESDKKTQTIGNVTGDQNVTGNTIGGDANINFGVKP